MENVWERIYKSDDKTSKEEVNMIIETVKNNQYLTKEDILLKVGLYTPSQNCSAAADGFLEIISKIAPYRSDVTEELLTIAIRPMYYRGAEDTEDIISWIEQFAEQKATLLEEDQKEWLMGIINDVTIVETSLKQLKENEKKY